MLSIIGLNICPIGVFRASSGKPVINEGIGAPVRNRETSSEKLLPAKKKIKIKTRTFLRLARKLTVVVNERIGFLGKTRADALQIFVQSFLSNIRKPQASKHHTFPQLELAVL